MSKYFYKTDWVTYKPGSEDYDFLYDLGVKTTSLYNKAVFLERQHFFETGKILNLKDLYQVLNQDWIKKQLGLPSTISSHVLKNVAKSFLFFMQAKDKNGFKGKNSLPGYRKNNSFYPLVIRSGSVSRPKVSGDSNLFGYVLCSRTLGFKFMSKLPDVSYVQIHLNEAGDIVLRASARRAGPTKQKRSGKYVSVFVDGYKIFMVSNDTGYDPVIFDCKSLKRVDRKFENRLKFLKMRLNGTQDRATREKLKFEIGRARVKHREGRVNVLNQVAKNVTTVANFVGASCVIVDGKDASLVKMLNYLIELKSKTTGLHVIRFRNMIVEDSDTPMRVDSKGLWFACQTLTSVDLKHKDRVAGTVLFMLLLEPTVTKI